MDDDKNRRRVNPGYAAGQLWRALRASLHSEDAAVRARASARVERWTEVLTGLASGALQVGSRTPVDGVPAWATLEVLHGGFASGRLLAEGPLQPHEIALGERLGVDGRAGLNGWYASDDGRRELAERLSRGTYRLVVPEEGALLIIAWLVAHDDPAAFDVLDAIAAWADRLRFYPVPADAPPSSGAVHRWSVGDVRKDLSTRKVPAQLARMNDVLTTWLPYRDRLVALLLETDDLREVPPGWAERARAVLDARPPGDVPRRVREVVEIVEGLIGREGRWVAMRDLRRLRGIVAREGRPGSAEHAARRAADAAMASRPTFAAIARGVADRLTSLPADEGLEDPDAYAGPVDGHDVPDAVLARLRRALDAPVDQLVAKGLIPSAEVLAGVLPQWTSRIAAAGIADPELRRVFTAVYESFRRRRSLLLLDLQRQVRLEELPWIAAVQRYRTGGRAVARASLDDVAVLSLTTFPHTILPNPLLTEIAALAKAAGVDLPLTEELAADIFMGTFTRKFADAAKDAAELLGGTLYERYYDLPYDRVRRLDLTPSRKGAFDVPAFARLCESLAGADAKAVGTSRNGLVIERQQVLTTHNLATLVGRLGLRQRLAPADLADRCFEAVLRRLARCGPRPRHRLHAVKDAAYAWRQMLFFLSLCDHGDVLAFLDCAEATYARGTGELVRGFEPAMTGLRQVVEGGEIDGEAGRRFFGWSVAGRGHWLLAVPPAS